MLISSTMPGGELPSFVSYLRSMSRSAMSCWLRRLCLRTTNLPRLVWQSGINVERASLMCDDRTEDYDHRKHEQHLPPGCARRNTCRITKLHIFRRGEKASLARGGKTGGHNSCNDCLPKATRKKSRSIERARCPYFLATCIS